VPSRGCCPPALLAAELLPTRPDSLLLSDPESQIRLEKRPEEARRVLRHAVAESRAGIAEGGNSFGIPPLYGEAPAVARRGSCEVRGPTGLVGPLVWLRR